MTTVGLLLAKTGVAALSGLPSGLLLLLLPPPHPPPPPPLPPLLLPVVVLALEIWLLLCILLPLELRPPLSLPLLRREICAVDGDVGLAGARTPIPIPIPAPAPDLGQPPDPGLGEVLPMAVAAVAAVAAVVGDVPRPGGERAVGAVELGEWACG